jgi:hypothetical protein
MIDDDDYGAIGGMSIGRGNRSTRRKPAPMPLCPPQIPHDLGSNPGRRGWKPATNRWSYGMTIIRTNSHTGHIKVPEGNRVLMVHDSVNNN